MAQTRRYQDFTGQKVGHLLVVTRLQDNPDGGSDKIRWLAMCECGQQVEVSSRQLRRTPNRSCGCKRRIHAPLFERDPLDTNINDLFSRHRKDARRREIDWSLTKERWYDIILSSCYYCGTAPNRRHNVFDKKRYQCVRSEEARKRHDAGVLLVNGIDRIDSSKGYTQENVVSCCKSCNYAKHTRTQEEFLDWITKVYEYQHARRASTNS